MRRRIVIGVNDRLRERAVAVGVVHPRRVRRDRDRSRLAGLCDGEQQRGGRNAARKPSQRTTARAGRQQILDPAAVEKPPRERAARTARQLSKRAVPESETRKQIAATDTQCRGDLRLIVEMLETGTPSGGDYIFILQPHLHPHLIRAEVYFYEPEMSAPTVAVLPATVPPSVKTPPPAVSTPPPHGAALLFAT